METTSDIVTIGDANHRIEITATGAKIIGDPSLEQWSNHLKGLKRVKTAYHLALSDLVKYGKEKYGIEAVNHTLVQLEFDLPDGYRALAISRVDDATKSVAGLHPEQLYILGRAFPDDSEGQAKWGQIAVEEKLSAADLRMSIANGTVTRSRDRVSGLLSMESVAALFKRCVQSLKNVALTVEDRANLRSILRPIVEFDEALKD